MFRFAAVAAGQTMLMLIYRRAFELDVPPRKTFTASIVVC